MVPKTDVVQRHTAQKLDRNDNTGWSMTRPSQCPPVRRISQRQQAAAAPAATVKFAAHVRPRLVDRADTTALRVPFEEEAGPHRRAAAEDVAGDLVRQGLAAVAVRLLPVDGGADLGDARLAAGIAGRG